MGEFEELPSGQDVRRESAAQRRLGIGSLDALSLGHGLAPFDLTAQRNDLARLQVAAFGLAAFAPLVVEAVDAANLPSYD